MSDSKKQHIAVTGSQGQLGRELATAAKLYPQLAFRFLSRDEFPLDDLKKVEDWIKKNPVDILVNTAAYTAVDKAESEKEKAFQINAAAPGFIAEILQQKKGKLIQISTDYVFDGRSSKPLSEDAKTNPINVYGATKLEGENLAIKNNPETQIIRTSWLYAAHGHNFVKTMIRLMKERPVVQVVQDQKGSPTYAGDLAGAILEMLNADRYVPGVYHYSNEGETSWYDFAVEIKKLTGSHCEVLPIASTAFPTAAKRPEYSMMDKSKIKSVYDLTIPDWKTSLARCIELIKNQEV
jgi:dTDP-4-dehydrorhamnose reductase